MTESRSVSSSRSKRTSPATFYRQVVAELRKVIWPTRRELITYTTVVVFFVAALTVYVSILDGAFGRLVLWVFGYLVMGGSH